jgi:sugar phosphate isomerase/epimerase
MHTGIAAAGTLLSADVLASNYNKKTIGLQLYSLRDEIPGSSIEAVLKKMAAIGYNSVEFYGYNTKDAYFKKSAKEIAAILKANKMISPSGHYDLKLFNNDTQQVIDASLEVGHQYIVIPWLAEELRTSLDKYKALAEKINNIALQCKQNNIKLAYHNHDFEFKKMEGDVCGYDIMLKETDKTLVDFELDLFWVASAGHDAVEMFKQNPGRFKMWHVKDMDKTDSKKQTEVGSGSIDFKPIFAQAKLSGLEYFYVEQENLPVPGDANIKKSYDFIKKNLIK